MVAKIYRPFFYKLAIRLAYRGGVLAAKVSDFGSNLLKWARAQMGTKPAKVGHSAPGAI